MKRQRREGTQPELKVRRSLHSLGHRFRVRNADLPGKPDIANRTHRWAVFVHGCFWHAHEGCSRHTVPKRNRSFWLTKFSTNRARDNRVADALKRMGYRVLTVWECQTANEAALRKLLDDALPRQPA